MKKNVLILIAMASMLIAGFAFTDAQAWVIRNWGRPAVNMKTWAIVCDPCRVVRIVDANHYIYPVKEVEFTRVPDEKGNTE